MKIKKYFNSIVSVAISCGALLSFNATAKAQVNDPLASSNGKYGGLIQVMNCPSDRSSYGSFNDYGYWGGGAWCGQTGKAGYWVWVAPNWYVWRQELSPSTSVNGKYGELIQVLNCPSDRGSYGDFNDYGYWGGGSWCGQTGKAGYWVWQAPNWYIWKYQR